MSEPVNPFSVPKPEPAEKTQQTKPSSSNTGSFQIFDSDIRATTQAFNSKIQQKKKEQEKFLSEAEKRARIRQSYILQAMVGMRKSMREITRLDLGDRFCFSVRTDDWQGWPRITLNVIDELNSNAEFPHFQVLGGYRDGKAQVDIDLGDPSNLMTYNLLSEADIKNLSQTFKKMVRSYLDMIGDAILQAERAPLEKPIEQIAPDVTDPTEPTEQESDELQFGGDLFEEDQEDSLFEALPHLDEVDSLPGWNGPGGNPAGNKPRR